MASNLSTIGFIFADEESFRTAMTACASDATVRLACAAGNYGIWRSRTGAEVWFHLGATRRRRKPKFIGLTPFFEGQSDVALKITGPVARDGDNPFEGALTGWVSPDDGQRRQLSRSYSTPLISTAHRRCPYGRTCDASA